MRPSTRFTHDIGYACARAANFLRARDDTTTPSGSSSGSSNALTGGTLTLVVCTSAIGGLILLIFLGYVVYRLGIGDDLVDVLKLRRRSHDDTETPAITFKEPFIYRSQRFSIRSYRFGSRRASTRSHRSRKHGTAKSDAQASQRPHSAYRQYTENYLIAPPSKSHPGPIARPKTKTHPPLPSTHIAMLLSPNASTSSLPKPEMAHNNLQSAPLTPTSFGRGPLATKFPNGTPESRRLTVSTRPVSSDSAKPMPSWKGPQPGLEQFSWEKNTSTSSLTKPFQDALSDETSELHAPMSPRQQPMDSIDEDAVLPLRTTATMRPATAPSRGSLPSPMTLSRATSVKSIFRRLSRSSSDRVSDLESGPSPSSPTLARAPKRARQY